MKIGIQSNLWSDEVHRTDMPRLLSEIAQAGFDGIEIGYHRLEGIQQPVTFLEMVQHADLHVSGIHTLGKFYFNDDIAYLERAAKFAQTVQTDYVLVSGEQGEKNLADLKAIAGILNRSGEICQKAGLTYCYHNHWWEIQNDQNELRTICQLTDPSLVSLCLDIGWVERSGNSVVQVVGDFIDRIRYFHLKDTRDERFVDLGEGTLDFPAWLNVIGDPSAFYLTHERDEVLPDALGSATRSRAYLRSLGL
jgi:sugar phosphate isomerase/epimerase